MLEIGEFYEGKFPINLQTLLKHSLQNCSQPNKYLLTMSRRRNRHRSLSNTSKLSERSQLHESTKLNKLMKSTAQSFYMSPRTQRHFNPEIQTSEQLYNRNISFFRDNFNQNDISQLPFMSSLREGQSFRERGPNSVTICAPFEAALKNTANQVVKKRISDFSSKQTRLSGAYYRWHNKSGLNNKWVANFECSLRDYGEGKVGFQQKFNSYVKPIVYNDVQEAVYNKEDLICTRRSKSFKIK